MRILHHHCYQSFIDEEDVLGNVELAKSEAAVPHHRRVLPDRQRHDHHDDHYVEGEGAGIDGGE